MVILARAVRETRDPLTLHQDSWKDGRSDEVLAFVEKVERIIWKDFGIEGAPKELTDFQRGYLSAEINHIKSGGRPSFELKNFDETFNLLMMLLIDCPP